MYSNCDCVTVQADYVITDIKFQATDVGGNLLGVKSHEHSLPRELLKRSQHMTHTFKYFKCRFNRSDVIYTNEKRCRKMPICAKYSKVVSFPTQVHTN